MSTEVGFSWGTVAKWPLNSVQRYGKCSVEDKRNSKPNNGFIEGGSAAAQWSSGIPRQLGAEEGEQGG